MRMKTKMTGAEICIETFPLQEIKHEENWD
jgi:hypothetical protein